MPIIRELNDVKTRIQPPDQRGTPEIARKSYLRITTYALTFTRGNLQKENRRGGEEEKNGGALYIQESEGIEQG